MTTSIASKFGLPDELLRFVDNGTLEVTNEDESQHTIEFSIPSLWRKNEHRRITAYALTWIDPSYNSQFCHYYDEVPGDMPNFFVRKLRSDLGDEYVEDLNDLDDLVAWLEEIVEV